MTLTALEWLELRENVKHAADFSISLFRFHLSFSPCTKIECIHRLLFLSKSSSNVLQCYFDRMEDHPIIMFDFFKKYGRLRRRKLRRSRKPFLVRNLVSHGCFKVFSPVKWVCLSPGCLGSRARNCVCFFCSGISRMLVISCFMRFTRFGSDKNSAVVQFDFRPTTEEMTLSQESCTRLISPLLLVTLEEKVKKAQSRFHS